MHNNLKLIFCFLIIFSCGCAQQFQRISVTSKQGRQQYLSKLTNWNAKGRVAIRDRDEGHTASILWKQRGTHYDITLTNPLASETIHITPANIDETYLYELPADQLRYWLKGIPSPNSPVQQAKYDEANLLKTLQQDGWNIDYQSYAKWPPIMIPDKIVADKDDIHIKIIMSFS